MLKIVQNENVIAELCQETATATETETATATATETETATATAAATETETETVERSRLANVLHCFPVPHVASASL